MNILLIGGSGFVSGTMARTALEAGHRVWALSRGNKPLVPGAAALRADRDNHAAFENVVRAAGTRWDLAVDCIGYEVAHAKQDIEVLRDRVRQLVFISTDFVFDPDHRRLPRTEEHPCIEGESYGAKKRACELELANGDTGDMAWTVLRPCHIYGPGSRLGCLPLHSRDPELLATLEARRPLKLVGGGHFLQQPLFARDLATLVLSCAENPRTRGQTYVAPGPDTIESREYYRIIAEILGVPLEVQEFAVDAYLRNHPEAAPFLCHRIYGRTKLLEHGLSAPGTPIEQGLRQHVEAWRASAGP